MATNETYTFIDDEPSNAESQETYEFIDEPKKNTSQPLSSKIAPRNPAVDSYLGMAKNALNEQKSRLNSGKSGDWINSPLGVAAEVVGNAATGIGSSVYGGLKGINTLLSGGSTEEATKNIEQAQQDYTYQPKSETAKFVSSIPAAIGEGAKYVTGGIGEGIGRFLNGEKGAVAGRAIAETATDAAPVLLGGISSIRNARKVRAAERLPIAGEDYTPTRQLSDIEKTRLKEQTSVGIKPTLGSVTRSPDQLRFENLQEQQTQTPSGAMLRQRTLENNQAMLDAVDKTKGANAGVVSRPSNTGLSTRDALLDQEKADAAKIKNAAGGSPSGAYNTGELLRNSVKAIRDEDWSKVGDLFDKARKARETQDLVDVSPLNKFFEENKIEATTVAPVLDTAAQKLQEIVKKKKVVTPGAEQEITKYTKFGVPYKEKVRGNDSVSYPVTVEDAEQLRASISRIGRNTTDGATRHWANEITKKIDEVTDGKGGGFYQTARRARYDHEMKFNQPEAIQRVIGKSSDTDYRNATEDLFNKSIVGGSEAELSTLVDTLKSSKNGIKALREIKKQAADYAKVNGIDSIGERKLISLIGQNETNLIKSYSSKYRDNAAVARIIEKSSPSDYKITLDNVFNRSIIGGAPEEISSLTKELSKTTKGKQAIEQLKLSTVDYLLDGFTRTVGKNENRIGNAGTTGLKKAIADIGEENLRVILGNKDANEILKVLRVSDDLTTNSSRLRGSSTVTNAQTVLDQVKSNIAKKLISKVPYVGNYVSAGIDLLSEKSKQKMIDEKVFESLNPMRADAETIRNIAKQEKEMNKQNSNRYKKERLSEYLKGSLYSLPSVENKELD